MTRVSTRVAKMQLAQSMCQKIPHLKVCNSILHGPQLLPNTIFPNKWSTSKLLPAHVILSWSNMSRYINTCKHLSVLPG